jgi:hypothetical protein
MVVDPADILVIPRGMRLSLKEAFSRVDKVIPSLGRVILKAVII